jgi:glycosyltransferase involved in cell wall biosynthesis
VRTTILHVITGLRQGGAERNLFNLVTRSDRRRLRHIVAPLHDGGYWLPKMQHAGVDVAPLGWNDVWDAPAAYWRLALLMRRVRPDLVQSWLYHADLAATLAMPFAPRARLLWTLRNSDVGASGRKSWRGLTRILAACSRHPALIIANSERGLADHRALGYQPRRATVIANGVDTVAFAPSDRIAARRALGLPPGGLIIGMAARFDPFKDHATFLAAAKLARGQGFAGSFVLAGNGVTAREPGLVAEGVTLLGPVADMPLFYAALDVATLSSSHGEGSPNTIAEAMACGIPVVATDVGDAARMLTSGGVVVRPRDPRALANAWLGLAGKSDDERAALGREGRTHVCAGYSLKTMIAEYEAIYAELSGANSNK